ncbi:hypothetical protein BJ508DRAFT_189176, partial [Ascobolus immersus RN42]
ENDFIIAMINNGSIKLGQYYRLINVGSVHYAAISVHPEMKLKHFETEWRDKPEGWIAMARDKARQYWEKNFKHIQIPEQFANSYAPTPQTPTATNTNPAVDDDADSDDDWRERAAKRVHLTGEDSNEDAFELFQAAPPEFFPPGVSLNVFQYWTAKLKSPSTTNSGKRLALMAFTVLSVPPMSDEPERIFSSAGATLGKRRTAMEPGTLEAVEALKSWEKEG